MPFPYPQKLIHHTSLFILLVMTSSVLLSCSSVDLRMPSGKGIESKTRDVAFDEHLIPSSEDDGVIYARDYRGSGPTIFLLHGFPDNLHLYDYLVPELTKEFRVVTFDFPGWGESTPRFPVTAETQKVDLKLVIDYFQCQQPWLVAHDSSGPPAINYTLDNPDRVGRLVLLNTYYSSMDGLKKPEAIWLFSTPFIRSVAGSFGSKIPPINRYVYGLQVGSFVKNEERRIELLPGLFQSFVRPQNFKSFLQLNKDLDAAILRNDERRNQLSEIADKTLIVFGEEDPYLNPKVARGFKNLLPESSMHLIANAGHYVQVDAPEAVARRIIELRD